MTTRRNILTTAATTVAGVAAIPVSAAAFSLTEPNESVKRQLENACSARSRHAQLVAEIRRTLRENGQTATEADVRRAAQAMTCPLCGCPVTAGLPDGAIGDDRQG